MKDIYNLYYFAYIVITIVVAVALYFLFRGANKRIKWGVIAFLLVFNVFLHFFRLAFEPYKSGKNPFEFTPENICAVVVLGSPFLFLFKRAWAKDYIFYIGAISGICSLIYPNVPLDIHRLPYNVIRFYICHSIIAFTPILMMLWGLHTLSWKRLWLAPVMLLATLSIILINEVILASLGWIDGTQLLNSNVRNVSFVFGPSPHFAMEQKQMVDFIMLFVPSVFVRELNGQAVYVPVLWLAIPSSIFITLASAILHLPFGMARLLGERKSNKNKAIVQ